MDPDGVWVYAVRRDTGGTLPDMPGVSGEKLRTVCAAGLCAVVGSVPMPAFSAEALERHLNDLDWLSAAAGTHNAVIEAVADAHTAIPVRLAVICRDDESVRALLKDRRDDFTKALDLVDGRAEWGVKIFMRPIAAPAAPEAPASGADYLRRRRDALRRNNADRAAAELAANDIYRELRPVRSDPVSVHPLDPSLTGITKPMLLNAAYLVDHARSAEFVSAVSESATSHPEVEVERTGPWLPYSFVGSIGDLR